MVPEKLTNRQYKIGLAILLSSALAVTSLLTSIFNAIYYSRTEDIVVLLAVAGMALFAQVLSTSLGVTIGEGVHKFLILATIAGIAYCAYIHQGIGHYVLLVTYTSGSIIYNLCVAEVSRDVAQAYSESN